LVEGAPKRNYLVIMSQASKPTGADEPRHIKLKVVKQDGTEICFKLKKTSTLGKLKKSYCQRYVVIVYIVLFHDIKDKTSIDNN